MNSAPANRIPWIIHLAALLYLLGPLVLIAYSTVPIYEQSVFGVIGLLPGLLLPVIGCLTIYTRRGAALKLAVTILVVSTALPCAVILMPYAYGKVWYHALLVLSFCLLPMICTLPGTLCLLTPPAKRWLKSSPRASESPAAE